MLIRPECHNTSTGEELIMNQELFELHVELEPKEPIHVFPEHSITLDCNLGDLAQRTQVPENGQGWHKVHNLSDFQHLQSQYLAPAFKETSLPALVDLFESVALLSMVPGSSPSIVLPSLRAWGAHVMHGEMGDRLAAAAIVLYERSLFPKVSFAGRGYVCDDLKLCENSAQACKNNLVQVMGRINILYNLYHLCNPAPEGEKVRRNV
jgi:hypothetical protein